VDRSLSYVSCNGEAIQILGYPDNIERLTRSQLLLTKEIRSRLKTERSSDNSLFVTQFQSGRRRYFCRAFQIDTHTGGSDRPGIAVLFERGPSALVPLSQVGKQFNLTQREREALEYVLQGLSSKAIANRMRISPNTVKAYMRLIMIKTGVSSRSAMISKIILTQPQ
jgi:DNA-binding CsgD family transcriptional regulator